MKKKENKKKVKRIKKWMINKRKGKQIKIIHMPFH